MNDDKSLLIYWDASAILSTLFEDIHSEEAQHRSRQPGVHLLSSLAYAEVHAVIVRIKREGVLADILIDAALSSFEQGPWRRLNLQPEWSEVQSLADKWRLRGADLWHLATAHRLQAQLPELRLLTFDQRLQEAVIGENMGLPVAEEDEPDGDSY